MRIRIQGRKSIGIHSPYKAKQNLRFFYYSMLLQLDPCPDPHFQYRSPDSGEPNQKRIISGSETLRRRNRKNRIVTQKYKIN
jgi:hypothetical protein